MKKIKFNKIIDLFKDKSISFKSDIDVSDTFSKLTSVKKASANDLSFFSNIKYLNDLKKTDAKACLINEDHSKYLPLNCKPIIVDDPYLTLALISQLFNQNTQISNGKISHQIFRHDNSKINSNVQIDPFTYIDDNTEIMENVIIKSNCKIGPNVKIHKNCIIHDNVTISDAIVMENCEIKSGARIGGSGFGFEEKSKKKIFHNGNVVIMNNCTIGANTTIDKAVFDSTIVGEYSQIDNLVQIAHNVELGKHSILAAQVGIAGSTKVGDYIKIGGQTGIAGHLEIGKNVTIAGKSGVTKNLEDGSIVAGFPAKDIKEWKKDIIKIRKINDNK